MRKHMNTKHETSKSCEICGRLCSDNNGLKENKKKVHNASSNTIMNKTPDSHKDTTFDEADLADLDQWDYPRKLWQNQIKQEHPGASGCSAPPSKRLSVLLW